MQNHSFYQLIIIAASSIQSLGWGGDYVNRVRFHGAWEKQTGLRSESLLARPGPSRAWSGVGVGRQWPEDRNICHSAVSFLVAGSYPEFTHQFLPSLIRKSVSRDPGSSERPAES